MMFWLPSKLFGDGLKDFRILERNQVQVPMFLTYGSKLFFSNAVEWKRKPLYNLCLILKTEIASVFFVIYDRVIAV